ncbi:MAG: polysaccharide deacetylase family protein [Candidatus Schekmanbacteria bacterium]|nr:polysaccharide deacetylase family protein [Candidatus Schekmanbacteria bacterium]
MIIVKKIFKLGLSWILVHSGFLTCYLKNKRKGILILRYHRIFADDKESLHKIGISKQNFEKQLQYLKNNHKILTLEAAVEILKNQKEIPAKALVITFDDGYKDNWENAFPLLQKYALPATIYLTAGLIGTADLLYWDRLKQLILTSEKSQITLGTNVYKLSTFEEKGESFYKILSELKKADDSLKNKLLGELAVKLPGEKPIHNKEDLLLSWEEVTKMQEAGISFGGHTVNHPLLTRVSLAEAKIEIRNSKNIIEEKLACPVTTFAYPGGAFNPDIRRIVADCGYEAACSTVLGINYPNSDLFALKRKGITDGSSTGLTGEFSPTLFAVEVSGLFDRLFTR